MVEESLKDNSAYTWRHHRYHILLFIAQVSRNIWLSLWHHRRFHISIHTTSKNCSQNNLWYLLQHFFNNIRHHLINSNSDIANNKLEQPDIASLSNTVEETSKRRIEFINLWYEHIKIDPLEFNAIALRNKNDNCKNVLKIEYYPKLPHGVIISILFAKINI